MDWDFSNLLGLINRSTTYLLMFHRQAKGSGLGLYSTRQIVEADGDEIWAENRVHNGAIFTFRLPFVGRNRKKTKP